MVATQILFRRDTERQRARRRAMPYRTLLVVFAFVCGAEASTYTTRAALKAAVDTCLSNDATGQSCNMNLWDVSSVTSMYNMFGMATAFNADISAWDTSSVEEMSGMFYGATAFNADISAWDTSSATSMYYTFGGATSFNADISGWDTSSVTTMYGTFSGATSFNADISGWNTSSVTTMNALLYGATSFNADISAWDTSSVTDMNYMFHGATSFNADISGWDTSSLTTMSYMFYEATSWLASCTRSAVSTDGPPNAWTCVYPPPPATSYCLPSQDWQYHCGPEPYIGSLTCPVAQQPCGGGCDDGSMGSTFDQCNQCLSDGHKGLDGVATCDASCTPGDDSDPCFKGFIVNNSTTTPPPPGRSLVFDDESFGTRLSVLVIFIVTMVRFL